MTVAGLLHWLAMHDVRLSKRGGRLLVDSPKGVLADPLLAELRQHKAELLVIVRDSGDTGDGDRTSGRSPRSGVLSPASANSAAAAGDLPPRANVRAARERARRLGVLDGPFPSNPSLAEAWWVEGDVLDELPEQLQGLTIQREGWTPESWACELQRKADLCVGRHIDTAEIYRRAATLLRRGSQGNNG